MAKLSFTECFSKYNAILSNPNWAVSAQSTDKSIVISCWENYFSKPDKHTMRYSDTLSRWQGNALGNNLLREHLQLAKEQSLPIRLVIATTKEIQQVDNGSDASKISKTFHIKPEVIGSLVFFDGDQFIIDFCKA